MKNKLIHILLEIAVFTLLLSQPVFAWNGGLYRDPASEAFMYGHNAQMQQIQNQLDQTLQDYEDQYRDELEEAYEAYNNSRGSIYIPWKTFVQNYLMSSGGQNPQVVIDQQKAFANAYGRGKQGLDIGWEDRNKTWGDIQDSKDRTGANWANTTMGYAPYTNPYTGQTIMLPYGPASYGGGYYYDGSGTYMYTPSGPYQVGPHGYPVPLEEESGFWDNLFGE